MVSEQLLASLRRFLNDEKIKLWLPPYTNEEGERLTLPEELVTRCAAHCAAGTDDVTAALQQLREHALEKLSLRNSFQQTGVARLTVKLTGHLPDTVTSRSLTLDTSLRVSGLDLKRLLADRAGIDWTRLKVICAGRVVEDDVMLLEQNVKNLASLMALCLSESEGSIRQEEERRKKLSRMREAAELLTDRDDNDDRQYLTIEDQNGKRLDLPPVERKALGLAMTLHEKGRACLKRREFTDALLYFTEADTEFKKCRSDILSAVDNYALLCLDMAWCYLCLQNIDHLPDAEARLKACDDSFRRSYGPQLERLALLKGGTGGERALFMRLHLLQGALQFHQGRRAEARTLLLRAQSELQALTVDTQALTQVMAMGYSDREARLALRACENNVALATEHVIAAREAKSEKKKLEKEERRKRKLGRKLGKTANGEGVNVEIYEQLVSMGFAKGAAAESLRQTNNDLQNALKVLAEQPHLLTLPDPEKAGPADLPAITDHMIQQVAALGFPLEPAAIRSALLQHDGDLQRTVDELLRLRGQIPPEWLSSAAEMLAGAGVSDKTDEELQKEIKEDAMIHDLVEDIADDLQNDHLDLLLEEESELVQRYLSMLE